MLLEREEYVEQAYFFQVLRERQQQNLSTQDLLALIREELLTTTKLPLAVDFLRTELRHSGTFAPAMARLKHYFTPFQTFVIAEAERERGRFDLGIALEILEREARYRTEGATRQGIFLYQFECLSRNRLGYDKGLEAVAGDPMFDDAWREWINTVRRQVGLVDVADMIYVRSVHYVNVRQRQGLDLQGPQKPVLFGEKEGKIALANRRREPLLLFAALERHLNYPQVPRPKRIDESRLVLPNLMRRVERLEMRLKLLEEEGKGGIDLTKFYGKSVRPPEADGT
ncbi:MAG TPA: hypothetical protein VG826_33565 [Pirellulales bacterium]|nr:hypothetical protein [Pirellulales bacterium]